MGDDVKRYRYESQGGWFTYIIMSELSGKDREAFEKYLRGSTVPVVPGVGDIAYSWDYDQWIARRKLPRSW